MQEIILSALLGEWITRLADEIDRLDATLPLDRKFETHQQYISQHAFDLQGAFLSPETHPERFKEVQIELPHTELDTLRALMSDINQLAEDLSDSTLRKPVELKALAPASFIKHWQESTDSNCPFSIYIARGQCSPIPEDGDDE